ncbi:hypothetical protein ACIPUD_34515 [Bradyrhizobium sp. CAR08]
MMLVEMIEELGHKVVVEAGHLDQAQSFAETEQYDFAILDINLQGFNVQPVAEAIAARGRPFFFLSGLACRSNSRTDPCCISPARSKC